MDQRAHSPPRRQPGARPLGQLTAARDRVVVAAGQRRRRAQAAEQIERLQDLLGFLHGPLVKSLAGSPDRH